MNPDKELFCHEGAHCTERMVQVDEKVKLRVVSYNPAFSTANIPIVFIGGLATIMESFGDIIRDLTRDFPFHYIETRERSSSQISGDVNFDIASSARDIDSVVQALELENGKYLFLAYSLGGSIVAESYHFLKSKPRQIIFFEPTPVFHYPKWSIKLMKFSIGFNLSGLRPIAKWYIRNFVIDKRADYEMVVISSRALDNADPYKLRKTILAIADYTVWDKLVSIECPVLIIAASKDTMHVKKEIDRMVTQIKNSTYYDMETNKRSHSVEAAQVIRRFLKE
jgi:pimeloyl-ACP methyl ester carboxylesterase